MYVIVGKQNCIQCDEFKNLLDELGIQYNYLDITEMPNKTMKCLRMYCNSFPIGLCIINSFSNFEEALTHFEQIQIPASQVDFFFILNSRFFFILNSRFFLILNSRFFFILNSRFFFILNSRFFFYTE